MIILVSGLATSVLVTDAGAETSLISFGAWPQLAMTLSLLTVIPQLYSTRAETFNCAVVVAAKETKGNVSKVKIILFILATLYFNLGARDGSRTRTLLFVVADFKSAVSTNFTTLAGASFISGARKNQQKPRGLNLKPY